MGNFQDSRFLGVSPRAVGMTVVIALVTVGFFFIPEAVKIFLDGKPKSSGERQKIERVEAPREKVAKQSVDAPKAAESSDSLLALNTEIASQKNSTTSQAPKSAKKVSESDEGRRGGFFSGWNFQVKAPRDDGSEVSGPAQFSFDRVNSKEAQTFFKQGQASITKFFKRERGPTTAIQDAAQPIVDEVVSIADGEVRNLSVEEIGNHLREAHVDSLRAMYAAGADRGLLMRWIDLPVIKFIDEQGGVNAVRKMRVGFAPKLVLTDLSVRQRRTQGWGVDGRTPAALRAEVSISGSDIERVEVFANGRQVRVMKFPGRGGANEIKKVRVNGDAYGVWSFVAYDRYGGRPYTKSYSFYPRIKTFQQGQDGTYRIAFVPGSARNSLDRFFYAGGSGRRRASDPSISHF